LLILNTEHRTLIVEGLSTSGSDLSLPGLCGTDLVPFLFVGRQSPALELTVRAIHFTGMESLAALGTAIDAIAFGYPIFLLAPVGHLRHRAKESFTTTGLRHPAFLSAALVNQEPRSTLRPEILSLIRPGGSTDQDRACGEKTVPTPAILNRTQIFRTCRPEDNSCRNCLCLSGFRQPGWRPSSSCPGD
jgi:hypothetical protein